MADNVISYSDLIEPDDSFEKMANELKKISEQYEEMTQTIQRNSTRLKKSIRSGTTEAEEGARYAEKLKDMYIALDNVKREVSKSTSELTSKFHSEGQQSERVTNYIKGMIDKMATLRVSISETVEKYGNLSDAERQSSAAGTALSDEMQKLITQTKTLTTNTREVVSVILQREKAERDLNRIQEKEIKDLVSLRAKSALYRQEAARLAREDARLEVQGKKLNTTNEIMEASYNDLAKQYRINCDAINRMDNDQRKLQNGEDGLITKTMLIINQMRKLQEQLGNTRLNVGNYDGAVRNLNYSMAQVIRETPTLMVTFEHWILAISNNLPILWDNIKAMRVLNAERKAAGLATQSMFPLLAKSIVNWQTMIIILITAIGKWKQIRDAIKEVTETVGESAGMAHLMSEMNQKILKSNNGYSDHIVKLKMLTVEYRKLNTEASKMQWIKEHEDAFKQMDIDIDDINDAENIFIKNTEFVLKAFKLRAEEAAATAVATERYEESLKAGRQSQQIAHLRSELNTQKLTLLVAKKEEQDAARAYNRLKFTNPMDAEEARKKSMAAASLVKSLEKDIERIKDDMEDLSEDDTNWVGNLFFGPARTVYSRTIKDDKGNIYESDKLEDIKAAKTKQLEAEAKSMMDIAANTHEKLMELYKEYNIREYYDKKTGDRIPREKDPWKYIQNESLKAKKALYDTEAKMELDELKRQEDILEANSKKIEEDYKKSNKQLQDFIDGKAEGYRKLTDDEKKVAEETIKIHLDTLKRDQAILEREINMINYKRALRTNKYTQDVNNLYMGTLDTKSVEYKDMRIEQLELQRDAELISNDMKNPGDTVPRETIVAKYKKMADMVEGAFQMERFELQQKYDKIIFDDRKHNSIQIANFDIEQQKAAIEKKLELHKKGMLDMSEEEVKIMRQTYVRLSEESKNNAGAIGMAKRVNKFGLMGGLLSYVKLPSKDGTPTYFNDDQLKSMSAAKDTIIGYLNDIFEAEQEMIEKEMELLQDRVDAYKSLYDAEVEMRANGYAANVEQARLDYELEKQKADEKQKVLEDAQKKQAAVDTMTQTSSLITAAAGIWASLASIPYIGYALAAAAVTGMFASFAVSKVKAKQATAASQEYGDGGLEFMEGGSHASGNDINLGVKNRKGRTMKVEGGEALAVINKKRTAQYKSILPALIDSLNKGTFEDKFLNAFSDGSGLSFSMNNNIDLSRLENTVENIRKQNEFKMFSMPDGTVIMQKGNVKRIIRK